MRSVSALLVSFTLAIPALADVPDGDVFLTWDGSRISTGLIPEGGTTADVTPNIHVFAGDLDDPDPRTGFDPGLMGIAGTFPVPSSNTLRFRSSVKRFDASTLSFPSTASGDYFRIYLGAVQAATPGSPLGLGSLFTLPVDGPSGTPGEWHHHPFWELNPSAPSGIYLAEVDIANSVTNIASDRFFFLWNFENDPMNPTNNMQAAYDWVNTNLVPAPGMFAMGLPIFASGLLRRRK